MANVVHISARCTSARRLKWRRGAEKLRGEAGLYLHRAPCEDELLLIDRHAVPLLDQLFERDDRAIVGDFQHEIGAIELHARGVLIGPLRRSYD